MRLWSLHPRYLDQQGLCGLWREAIMVRNALEQGEDHGYWNHPQLERFKDYRRTVEVLNFYLYQIYQESQERGYNFDENLFEWFDISRSYHKRLIGVSKDQVRFELSHLLKKLKARDRDRAMMLEMDSLPWGKIINPVFHLNDKRGVAEWERGELD